MLKITRRAALALLMLTAFAAPSFAQTSVAGTWLITVQGPDGPGEVTAVFAQEGNVVTGAIDSPMVSGTEMSDGMIDGDKLTFLLHVDLDGQWFTVEVNATVAEDMMEGSFYMADFGTMPFTGRRSD